MNGFERMKHMGWSFVLMCAVLMLDGCSSVRPWQNLPMRPTVDRVAAMQDAPEANDRSMLMLVSMSGGGARAAAFGYGVLDALRQTQVHWQGHDTSLLDEIDVISGVSGGSIMAAYFAAFGKDSFPAFEQQFLRKKFQDNLISNAFKPGNLYDLTSPWFGRSNLLERRLDELFKGKTFGDLKDRPGQPRLLVSATDLTLGTSFEFSWRQFSLICSDLDSVPLSFAVAASSAVPMVLSPMTLKNFSDECPQSVALTPTGANDYRVRLLRDSQRSYLDANARPYIHLVDGGLADNLGLRGLMDRSQADGSIRDSVRNVSSAKIQKLVIIAINAERDPSERIDTSDKVPSTAQVIDALLFGTGARATQETLALLNDTAQAWRRELRRAMSGGGNDPFAPDAQIHVINVNLRDAPDDVGRRYLLQIPTAFSIAPAEVSSLIDAGRSILLASPEFNALVKSMGGATVVP
ncbi:patatin-like phospholipase family protein [Rhodoferax sp.]|uniref:patatin-like phospholipase family protein n=1 Tax=Rhodoferax sp. TaxID=50421 RepID=UPI0028448752|nr:patatin-like phospholipase family protein [Rhodoferax sp.]MDR3372063.1 patatin-like phospholipase family protein [Rhodoferax sp.]